MPRWRYAAHLAANARRSRRRATTDVHGCRPRKLPNVQPVVTMQLRSTIEPSEEQRRELGQPEPLVIDPETQQTNVLVRKDVYDRLRNVL
jgi:hypothetical protein